MCEIRQARSGYFQRDKLYCLLVSFNIILIFKSLSKWQKKQKPASTAVAVTEDNVMEQIKNGNILAEANVKATIEEIQKQKDEKQKKEAMDMICRAKYRTTRLFLRLRARRREEKNNKEYPHRNEEYP